jgi:hypothetical protein
VARYVRVGWVRPGADAAQLTVAVINIHHFIVDAYIWRLRKDPNYRTVVDATAEPARPQA